MIWYYQYTSHDITEHEGGWSVNLANINVNGTSQQVVIQGTKGSQIYVVNAATGQAVYKPIFIGPPGENNWNDGLTINYDPRGEPDCVPGALRQQPEDMSRTRRRNRDVSCCLREHALCGDPERVRDHDDRPVPVQGEPR